MNDWLAQLYGCSLNNIPSVKPKTMPNYLYMALCKYANQDDNNKELVKVDDSYKHQTFKPIRHFDNFLKKAKKSAAAAPVEIPPPRSNRKYEDTWKDPLSFKPTVYTKDDDVEPLVIKIAKDKKYASRNLFYQQDSH